VARSAARACTAGRPRALAFTPRSTGFCLAAVSGRRPGCGRAVVSLVVLLVLCFRYIVSAARARLRRSSDSCAARHRKQRRRCDRHVVRRPRQQPARVIEVVEVSFDTAKRQLAIETDRAACRCQRHRTSEPYAKMFHGS
jgi:hypothetical protein